MLRGQFDPVGVYDRSGQTRAYALWIVIGSLFLAWFLIAR